MTINTPPKVFDEIDYQIIQVLRKDARMSSSRVAKEIGINERTARRRMDSLFESGALRISVVCEPSAFGYNHIVDVNMIVPPHLFEQTAKEIIQHPATCYLSHGLSADDVTVQARFKSGEEVNQFIFNFIEKLPGVKVKNYYLEASIIRDIDGWIPSERDFVKSSRITVKANKEIE